MDRRDYTDRVLSSLRRVTEKEREAIRSELDGHIEDHMEALRELGYDEELAEERAIAAMGEPDEVGRELNKQYPFRWLVVGWIAKALIILMVFSTVIGENIGRGIRYWNYRLNPIAEEGSQLSLISTTQALNLRQQVGNDELWIYQSALGVMESEDGGETGAEILIMAYDYIPYGVVSDLIFQDMTLESQDGTDAAVCEVGFTTQKGTLPIRGFVETKPGDTYVTLSMDRFGQSFSMQIPLPAEVKP